MKSVFSFPKPTLPSWRHVLADAVLIVAALYFSLWMRLGTGALHEHLYALNHFVGIFLAARLVVFFILGVYQSMWRYTSARDAVILSTAVLLSTVIFIAVTYLLPSLGYLPRSLFVIDAFVSTAMLMSMRIVRRFIFESTMRPSRSAISLGKVLIYGAGQNGRLLAQRMLTDPNRDRELLGFVDDDLAKRGKSIAGLPVLGNHSQMTALLENTRCTDLIVAISHPPAELMRELLILTRRLNIRLQKISHSDGEALYKKLELADLLSRPPHQVDLPAVNALLANKVVLITGAGGTIGSELARQISQFSPAKLLLLDHSEFNLFEIDRELRPQSQDFSRVVPLLLDIKDARALDHAFKQYSPQVIFHAAAYKHVHLVEANVGPAILNNIRGTQNLLATAERYESERFVMISSDKAVNPVGAMGATKRVCEVLTTEAGRRLNKPFSSVRFGNVLGSSGSLIPTLKAQIENGGPVTLTHPDMNRFFMLIPEAISLVLMSATLSEPGDINVLKMGEPVRILDLAKNLISLMGHTEEQIAIAFTGLRPGEKMYEELYITGDELATRHSEILTVPKAAISGAGRGNEFIERVQRLLELAEAQDPLALTLLLELANPAGLAAAKATGDRPHLH
jgi:FlaA1/EpsC-like NDP-sugar epimerase